MHYLWWGEEDALLTLQRYAQLNEWPLIRSLNRSANRVLSVLK